MLFINVIPVSAENSTHDSQNIINNIINYKLKESGASDIQQWIDSTLTEKAGISSEWYILALSQSGEYNFSSYENALLNYLNENEVSSAASRQKYALALIAVGNDDEYIYNTLNDSIGQLGLMSWIYGLHLLNNGYSSDSYSLEQVKDTLLSLQLDDGGWTVTGTSGEVDATAMAIQALAPYYDEEYIQIAIDNALNLLSSRQQENGDYASYGVNNPESTAQVLIALSSLGIDCKTDSRFIKNGNTLFDGIEQYRLSDGSYCHSIGGEYNEISTVQVFYSMVSYQRMKNGQTNINILDEVNLPDDSSPNSSDISISTYENEQKTTTSQAISSNIENNYAEQKNSGSYKLWVCLAIIILSGGICIALFCTKKRNINNFIIVLTLTGIAIIIVLVTDFQTADEYYNNADKAKENSIGTVTITIRCDTIIGKSNKEYIPEDGIILEVSEIEIEEGETVYDVLSEITAKKKIHIETTGNSDSIYVQGISNIYEFDFGDLSGWIYCVNGEKASVSCSDYKLSDGDEIEWLYTCKLGEDIS
ncbi:MAG: DUF4430 domain-containing protein [Hominimerdicola sp.]